MQQHDFSWQVRGSNVPWESSQHARALAPGCAVRRAITAATVTGDPIIAARGLQKPHPDPIVSEHHRPSGLHGVVGTLDSIAYRADGSGEEEVAKADGTRRRGAANGRGAWRRAAAGAAAWRRTAARTARVAGPRHAMAG
jgi:hypothetical protein